MPPPGSVQISYTYKFYRRRVPISAVTVRHEVCCRVCSPGPELLELNFVTKGVCSRRWLCKVSTVLRLLISGLHKGPSNWLAAISGHYIRIKHYLPHGCLLFPLSSDFLFCVPSHVYKVKCIWISVLNTANQILLCDKYHMALQPNTGPGLPFWVFVTMTFLQGWIVSPAPNPQPGGPGLHIYDPRRQGGPAIPPGTGYPF
jgi:hypothetical protein